MAPIIKKVLTSQVTEVTDRIKRIKSSDKSAASYYVFKTPHQLRDILASDERARKEIVARAQGKAVYLLEYDKTSSIYILTRVSDNGTVNISDGNLIDEIREYDLNEVIRRTNGDCILDAPPNVHFITPSRKHTTRFLRLTDALYSYNALDRVSFWLQPYVQAASAVIIDTWSLASIVLKTQQLLGINIPFDCFHEHIGVNEERALITLNKLGRQINKSGPVLFVVSVSSSGTFSEKLPHLLEASSIKNDYEIISIYGFNNTPKNVNRLATLDFEIIWYDESDCHYCRGSERQKSYVIDPKYYYPRTYEETAVRFHKGLLRDASNNRSLASVFVHKYGASPGVLQVHRDDPNDGITPRHHAFYIDVAALMNNQEFQHELNLKLKEIADLRGVPDVVISPPHNAAKQIVDYVRKKWPKAKYVMHHNLRGISTEERGHIFSAENICFLDDVTITGTRITEYLRALREVYQDQVLSAKTVTWFPLIARAASPAGLSVIRDAFSEHAGWSNHLTYVYDIALPNWTQGNECPWCQEESIFERKIGALWDEPAWYENRRDKLRNRQHGISDHPLFIQPFTNNCTLGNNSPLGDEGCNEMQLLFLISAGLQLLRHDKSEPLGRDDMLQSYVLFWHEQEDKKYNTFLRFTEPLIQAVFLRTVQVGEWSRTLRQTGAKFIASRIASGTCDVLVGEALLFLLRNGYAGPLPKPLTIRITNLLKDHAISILLDGFNNKQ